MDRRQQKIHPLNALFAAVGLLGTGIMIGGWTTAQTSAQQNPGEVTGIAIDSNSQYLYRTFKGGKVERLVLGRGLTASGTTAEWQRFKD